jgi:hypothetical protein
LSENKRGTIRDSKDARLHVEICPDLSECVETKARKEYNRLSSLLLAGSNKTGLAERLEVLRLFLDTMDFRALRSESEKFLIEGKTVKYLISKRFGKMCYEIRVEQ